MHRRLSAIAAVSILAACGAPSPRPTPARGPAAAAPAAQSAPVAGAVYHIDSSRSELKLLVYRAGAMASVGHNHVILNRALEGWVRYGGAPSDAAFVLQIPAAGFVIDDARARAEEGADFAEDVSADAKAGTLHNMLSPALLDAAQFPMITVRSLAVEGSGDGLRASVAVELAGHSSTLTVPFRFDDSAGRLNGSGALTLRQSALGLVPYSVFLGALRVQDEMRVTFKLVAAAN